LLNPTYGFIETILTVDKKARYHMGLLQIDERKCKKDGVCVGECPVAIMYMKDKDSVPEMVPGGDQVCLLCGHCVAVCPHGALSHAKVPIESCPPVDKDLVINAA